MRDHSGLWLLVAVSLCLLSVLAISGLIIERNTHTPLVRVGAIAPDFRLPATTGRVQVLDTTRGHPVVLAFVPSVHCAFCQQQLLTLEAALPALQARGIEVFAISTDELPIQQAAVVDLKLTYPLLSEAPTIGQHPAGSAYGIYHLTAAPVDANTLIVIDAQGVIRAVRVQPEQTITKIEILALVSTSLGITHSRLRGEL